jgi:hypothetical protein
MLLVYVAAGALFLALGSYVYGTMIDATRTTHASDTPKDRLPIWERILLDCDFGPSPHTNGPARTIPVDEKLRLTLDD